MAWTYATLTQAIKDWLVNNETTFSGNLDKIIDMAERRIYMAVKGLQDQRKLSQGTTTASNKYLGLPGDVIHFINMFVIDALGQYWPVEKKDAGFIYTAYAPTVTGRPKYYAQLDDDSALLGPTPDIQYTMEMHYHYFPNSIVTDLTTWLGTNAPQALLAACVLEAYIYEKGEAELFEVYKASYDEAIGALQDLVKNQKTDAFRTGDV